MQAGSSSKLNSRAQRGKGQQNGAAITVSPVASPPARVIVNKHKPEYEHVLVDARIRRTYEIARNKFEDYLRENPRQCKAWVSYAMLEKRYTAHLSPEAQHSACRAVLQRGLQLNPTSTCIIQAFGLLELRRNNALAALMMLERCVRLDPKLQPVLNWNQVALARQAVEERRRRRKAAEQPAGPAADATAQ